jgi:hypothetical protein
MSTQKQHRPPACHRSRMQIAKIPRTLRLFSLSHTHLTRSIKDAFFKSTTCSSLLSRQRQPQSPKREQRSSLVNYDVANVRERSTSAWGLGGNCSSRSDTHRAVADAVNLRPIVFRTRKSSSQPMQICTLLPIHAR